MSDYIPEVGDRLIQLGKTQSKNIRIVFVTPNAVTYQLFWGRALQYEVQMPYQRFIDHLALEDETTMHIEKAKIQMELFA